MVQAIIGSSRMGMISFQHSGCGVGIRHGFQMRVIPSDCTFPHGRKCFSDHGAPEAHLMPLGEKRLSHRIEDVFLGY